MMDVKILKMKPSDYRELYDFWKRTDGIGLGRGDTRQDLKKYLKRNPGMSFVARMQEYIIGSIMAGHDGRRGYIYHFGVEKEFRGKKIGKKMLSLVLRKFHDAGIHKCHIMVYKDNNSAREIWEKSGWTLRNDIVVMSKEI